MGRKFFLDILYKSTLERVIIFWGMREKEKAALGKIKRMNCKSKGV